LERGAVDIIQPNVGLLGILGTKKVAGVAETKYTGVAPWMYCGPVAGAANIQIDACIPNFLIQESIEDWSGFHNEILKEPLEFRDGYIIPPERPGLGVEPDPEVLEEYPPVEVPEPSGRPHYSMDANRDKIDQSDRMDL
jgi:2-dehydro-3-deoxyphosphogalactonate aldolase